MGYQDSVLRPVGSAASRRHDPNSTSSVWLAHPASTNTGATTSARKDGADQALKYKGVQRNDLGPDNQGPTTGKSGL